MVQFDEECDFKIEKGDSLELIKEAR